MISAESWAIIRTAIEPFAVPLTFINDLNEEITITIYPGDTHAVQ
ncbi:MAG: hypothetical protein ACK5ML_04330 [Lachnospiraceae bacterium]